MKLTIDVQRKFVSGPLIQGTLDLALDRFGITVLFGPSGCGKTTLLRMIAGLERPDGGTMGLDDAAWVRGPICLPACKRRVGYVFQEGALFPHLSVVANIAFGLPRKPASAGRVEALIRRVGLAGLEHRPCRIDNKT